MSPGSVALIGFMGAGKSTVGPRLAARAALPFVDLDHRVVEESGRPISEIFRTEGEEAFRDLESAQLELAFDPPAVVAAGGGVVERVRNRETLRARSTVIWLDLRLETVRARLRDRRGPARPLQDELTASEFAELYLRRRQLYAAAAHFHFECDDLAPTELVRSILLTLQAVQ